MNPFDFINDITFKKEDLIRSSDDPEHTAKQYNPFIANRGLSYFMDTIMYVNEMNTLHHLDKDMQFAYLINSIRKRKRFSKWHKPEKSEDVELIADYYQVNKDRAKHYLHLMNNEQLKSIKQKYYKGGLK